MPLRIQHACLLVFLLNGLPTKAEGEGRASPSAPVVKLGIDVLVQRGFAPLHAQRVGLITNPTGVTRDLQSTIDVLYGAPQVNLVALFGPEHGVRGEVAAGDHITDARDARTGLTAYSLYGKTRKPTPEMLAGVDVLVYDIQDIGSRSYTYISTLALAMESAAENDIAVIVLDRPNPLGGARIEGRPLDMRFQSFVGQLPIPYLHGMTVGELARMMNAEGWLAAGVKCDLTVIPMEGWHRRMLWSDTGLPWVPTSPHVPHVHAPAFYAATGIMGELHQHSEGVGTPLPFELICGPTVDPQAFADALNRRKLPGVWFRPLYIKPFYGRFTGKLLGGVQIHLRDPHQARLTPIQFHAMDVASQLDPDLRWFGSRRDRMFDKVCGTDEIRRAFEANEPIEKILERWNDGTAAFRERRKPYLLYPDQ